MKVKSKLTAFFKKDSSAKSIATLTVGTALAQGLGIAATPAISRLFTPEEFGVVAVFMAIAAVVATFVTLRYEVNILIPKSSSEAEGVVLLSSSLAVCLGLVVSIAAWCLPDSFRDFLGLELLGYWLPLACLTGTTIAISSTAFSWLNRCQLYKQIAKLRLLQSVLSASSAILFGLWSFKNGLLLAQMISAFLVMLLIVRYLPKPSAIGMADISLIANKYSDTPKYALPTSLLDVATLQLPVLLISSWYGASEAGQFSLAWRVLVLPAALVGGAVGQVFFQRFSAAWPDSNAAWSVVVKTWKILALVGLLPLIALMLFGEDLFSMVFGSKWAESGRMAAVLAPMLFVSLLHSPTSTTSIVLGVQKQVFVLAIAVLIYRPLALYIGWKLGDIYFGLAIYCILEILQIFIFQYGIYKKIKT